MLQLHVKSLVPGKVASGVLLRDLVDCFNCSESASFTDKAEQPAMLVLQQTYGKTIHTWAIDQYPDLPLGPPSLMMAVTGDGQGPPPEMVKARDIHCGMDTEAKRRLRAGYLPPYEKVTGSDEWERTGKSVVFEAVESEIRQ